MKQLPRKSVQNLREMLSVRSFGRRSTVIQPQGQHTYKGVLKAPPPPPQLLNE